MNWDTQLNSILHATDNSVAMMKQRLSTAEALSKVPELPFDFLGSRKSVYDMTAGTLQLCPLYTQSPYQGTSATEEAATIGSQLDTQAQKMEFLTQAVQRLERERQQQQHRILSLEEEVRCLRSVHRTFSDPKLESRMEELRQQVFSELCSLREQVLSHGQRTSLEQAPSTYLQQELADSKRMIWQESKGLRQEIRQLNQDLRRQEEDLHHHISDNHKVKKFQDTTWKMLEEVMDSHKSHSVDLERMKLEGEEREQELQAVRAAVMSLKDEMKNLTRDNKLSLHIPWHKTSKSHNPWRKQSRELLFASEDSASHLSLTDISSEEDVIDSTAHPSESLANEASPITSRLALDRVDDLSSDLEGLSDSLPELSCSDL
ncbi:coiled-coil domain-containing protein 159 [Microcaecilia unicolor]|uniref:Myosin-11-like n=1 Tax=Microcaecilia unicolor TaxID=1415580 RepID=A0A6P7Y2U9_9AMPH|nr:myosin-11-like [Microcaecilia unicolor]